MSLLSNFTRCVTRALLVFAAAEHIWGLALGVRAPSGTEFKKQVLGLVVDLLFCIFFA